MILVLCACSHTLSIGIFINDGIVCILRIKEGKKLKAFYFGRTIVLTVFHCLSIQRNIKSNLMCTIAIPQTDFQPNAKMFEI